MYFKEKYRTRLSKAWNDAGRKTNLLLITVQYHMKVQRSPYLQDVDTMNELAFH